MSDAPQQPDAGLARDAGTGRYVQRHAATDGAAADASAPAEAPAAAASADAPTAQSAAADTGTPPATQSGGDATPPATPPPAGPGEEKDGRKRWMLLLLLLLILLALLCAGFSYITWWRKDKPSAQPTPTVSVTSTGTGNPRPSPSLTSTPNTSPSPSPSASPAVKLINMPNVVGMPAADAKVILEGAGFTSVKFVPDANPNADLSVLVSYTVSKQSVAAGTQVPADTAIVITCRATSNGKG